MQSERKNKVFVPVTLNMVLEAPSGDNDEIELDGVKVPNVRSPPCAKAILDHCSRQTD